MTLTIIFFIMILFCLAMMLSEGMWSNAITVINITLAGLIATNYWEPAADWIDEQARSRTYFWDFIMIWTLFIVSFLILRTITDRISKVRVRFKMPVEITGRILLAILTGWIMVSFTCMTLHMAPLARTSFRDSFQKTPKSNNFLGMAPDRMWLGFIQSRSRGALSTSGQSASSDPADQGKQVFDAKGDFIYKYGDRRQKLYNHMKTRDSMLIRGR